jgi:hypothetical protein
VIGFIKAMAGQEADLGENEKLNRVDGQPAVVQFAGSARPSLKRRPYNTRRNSSTIARRCRNCSILKNG